MKAWMSSNFGQIPTPTPVICTCASEKLLYNVVTTLAPSFLAHLSRRLTGELIVYVPVEPASVRAWVRPSVHTFKHDYLCNQLAHLHEILSEASLGWGKGFRRF